MDKILTVKDKKTIDEILNRLMEKENKDLLNKLLTD